MRHPLLLLVSLSSVLACAKPGASEAPATASPSDPPPAAACNPVDTSVAPTISRIEEGGVVIHSFVAPETSAGSASHIIETRDGLVVVDTQLFRGYARQFREYADGLGKPISHVIITHGHPDHYFGLEHFEGLPVYALPETRLDMRQRHKFHWTMHRELECDAVTDRVRFPTHDLAVGEQTIGGVTLVFERVVDAEDNDQVVIRVPAAKTLIMQDLMATDVHGFTAAGMIGNWIAHLERYAALTDYTHVLAGHGAPVDHAGIRDMIAYLETCREIFAKVKTGDEFKAAVAEAFPDRKGQYLVDLMAEMKFEQGK